MGLRTTAVSRCLDKKLLVGGYEIPDLLAIFFLLSILNFTFGKTDMKLLLVWLPTALVAGLLRIGKRGKPDNYLIHLFRFNFKQKRLFAYPEPTAWLLPPRATLSKPSKG